MNKPLVLAFLTTLIGGCASFLTNNNTQAPTHFSRNYDFEPNYSKNIYETSNKSKKAIQREIVSSKPASIKKGMSKISVMTLFGDPNDIQVAGNAQYENEKWIYRRYVPTEAGYQKDTQVIYFEHGKVAGWD